MGTSSPATSDSARQLLRHTFATLAYRGGTALRGPPDGFAGFRVGEGSRTPAQILAHISDLLDWALSLAKGKEKWRDSEPLAWPQGVDLFFTALAALDSYLASDAPLGGPPEKIFQ